ncbi:DUF4435 domain-containing protein [Flavobacterium sp. RSP49]|uniref:DUF4435 domain-containing protein n=1 Tax=Flavobacterium sp. RSP49 TaxID=2497487 RepID=UPI001F176B74|nr:DUF4435 domain-containing protein [Flavobacterium sp. RSP49]
MIKHKIILPNRNGEKSTEEIELSNNLVLIGANGSGKTRLGVFVEEKLQEHITVHRISAQKALKLPDYAQIKNLGQAQDEFLVGYSGTALQSNGIAWAKNSYRWQNQSPATSSLNDYEQLLSLLFAKTTERDRLHTEKTRTQQVYIEVFDSVTDKIVKIWCDLMPHRSLKFSDGQVLISKKDQKEYHGKDMSDGERVILYLIGSCLCAPDNSIIIIDEPEVHIHKSIVSKLWNKIEENCPEKLLIYITHDLDFATSRSDATKLWIKAYHGENIWEWDFIPVEESLPESLFLEVLGNRKNIIFCEGENNSIDSSVYQLVYPDYHIMPRGGGDKVIESTKAFVNNPSLHHLVAHGLIDSDYKELEEKEILQGHGIYTIPVAEIENLYCIEPIIKIISIYLGLNPNETFDKAVNFIVESLKSEFDVQVSSKAEKIIEYKLGAFSKKDHTAEALKLALDETLSRINIDEIYKISGAMFQDAIDSRDYAKILLIYNRKSLPTRISGIFGLAKGEYEKLLVRLMKGDKQEEIVSALKTYLPSFNGS